MTEGATREIVHLKSPSRTQEVKITDSPYTDRDLCPKTYLFIYFTKMVNVRDGEPYRGTGHVVGLNSITVSWDGTKDASAIQMTMGRGNQESDFSPF